MAKGKGDTGASAMEAGREGLELTNEQQFHFGVWELVLTVGSFERYRQLTEWPSRLRSDLAPAKHLTLSTVRYNHFSACFSEIRQNSDSLSLEFLVCDSLLSTNIWLVVFSKIWT